MAILNIRSKKSGDEGQQPSSPEGGMDDGIVRGSERRKVSAAQRKAAATPSGIRFRRNFFVTETRAEPGRVSDPGELSSHLRHHERRNPQPTEFIEFSEKTRGEMSLFLQNYIKFLHEDSIKHPEVWQRDDFADKRELLRIFTDDNAFKTQLDSGRVDDTAFADRVNKLLETDPRIWVLGLSQLQDSVMLDKGLLGAQVVTHLNNLQDIDAQFQEGRHSQRDPTIWGGPIGANRGRGFRQRIRDLRPTNMLGRRQAGNVLTTEQTGKEGFVHKGVDWVQRNFDEVWDRGLKQALAAGTTLTARQVLIGMGYSGFAASSMAAILPAYWIYRSGARSGEQVKDALIRDLRAFESLTADPQMAAFAMRMRGGRVVPDDFEANSEGALVLKQLDPRIRGQNMSINVPSVLGDLRRNMETINGYHKDLGIEAFDTAPDDFVYRLQRGEGSLPNPAPTKFNELFQAYLQEDPIRNHYDVQGNLEKVRKAHRKATMEIATDYTTEVFSGRTSGKRVEELDRRIADRESGALAEHKAQEHREAIERLEQDETYVEQDQQVFETYQRELASAQVGQEEINAILHKELRGEFDTVEEAMRALDTLSKTLDDTTDAITIKDPNRDTVLTIEPVRPRRKKLDEWFVNEKVVIRTLQSKMQPGKNERPEDFENRRTQLMVDLKKEYEAEIEKLKTEIDVLISTHDRLEDAQTKAQQEKDRFNDFHPAATAYEEVAKRMTDTYEEITGWGFGNLNQDVLRTKSPDELMKQINAVHTASPAHGWAADQNDANRQRLIEAMAEARAQYIESQDPQVAIRRSGGFDKLHDPNGFAFSEHILRISTKDDLKQQIQQKKSGNNALPTVSDDEIVRAITEAKHRFTLRNQAFENVLHTLDVEKNEQQTGIAGIEQELEQGTGDLHIIRSLYRRQVPEIYDHTTEITGNIARFTETASANSRPNEYTDAEKAVNAPIGYYEFLHYLTDYKGGYKENGTATETNEQYFKRLQRLLPPDRLAEYLDEYLNLGLAGAPINDVLDEIRVRVNDHELTYRNFRSAFGDMIDRLNRETGHLG